MKLFPNMGFGCRIAFHFFARKQTSIICFALKSFNACTYNIEVYVIPGSHDFSPSGKTMLDVLENSGLVINVNKMDNNNCNVISQS